MNVRENYFPEVPSLSHYLLSLLKISYAQIFRTVFFVAMVGLSELTNGKTEVTNI